MDLDLDNSSKCSVESMTSIDQMELSSPETCCTGQDADMIEDSCSQDPMDLKVVTGQDADMAEDSCFQDLMDLKVVTDDDESGSVYMSETPEKNSSSFSIMMRELKQVQQKLDKKDDNGDGSFVEPTNKESLRASFPEDDLPAYDITQPKDFETEVEKRYARNLKKFLEDAACREVMSCKKTRESERRRKSNGETAKIIDYCGDMTRVSSILSKIKLQSSSAPPTFSDETESIQNSGFKEVLVTLLKSKDEDISKDMPESEKTTSISENSKAPISVKINKSFLERVPDANQSKSFPVFKVPAIPSPLKMLHKTPKGKNYPARTSEIAQVFKRPTDLNIKMRETFYTFSPNSGVIRQCRSLPNIGRPSRRYAKQRLSLNSEEYSRVSRSLFPTEPESSTPGTSVSTFPKCYSVEGTNAATSLEVSKSCWKEKSSPAKETSDNTESIQSNIKSKACRKLNFSSYVQEKIEEIKEAEETRKPVKESPSKRKGISAMVIEHLPASVKKVRTSLKFEKIEEDASGDKKVENILSSEEKTKD